METVPFAHVPMETIPAKTILQKIRYDGSKWFGMDYSMNLYRGCCHGCIYCDSRSECYRNDDFDTVKVKADALDILERELRSRRIKGVVGMGAMSDPYNPFETGEQVTRKALELIYRYGFGIALDTKGTLVTRDIDVFRGIADRHSVIIKVTITTADDTLARRIEPHAPSSTDRFHAVRELSEAGIYCGILLAPTLPFITDDEENIRTLIESAAKHGARFIYCMEGVTMRDRQRDYFLDKVAALDPKLPDRYRETFGDRYVCNSPQARTNRALFEKLCTQAGLSYRMQDIIKAYKREVGPIQQSLF